MSHNSKIVGAVEVGTAKVVALVGEIVDGRSLNIIGMGQSTSSGIKKGVIENFRKASDCTHAAILGAEKSAGAQVEGLYLAQTGRHLRGRLNIAEVNVKASSNRVAQGDLQKVCEECKGKELPPDRLYVHHIRNSLRLDGEETLDPVGLEGSKLGATYWSVDGDQKHIRNMIRIMNGISCRVEDIILSSVATGAVTAEEPEKKNGVLVIDIGCGTTDYVLYRNGFIVRTGVLPIGGDHFTNDLSLALRVNVKIAERHKLNHGRAEVKGDGFAEKVWLMGDKQIGDRQVRKEGIYQVLAARVDELFSLIQKELGEYASPQAIPAGIVLSGGSSRLPGLLEAASRSFGVNVRLGEHPPWAKGNLRKLEYSTVLGLLHYALSGNAIEDDKLQQADRGMLKKVSKFLKF